MSHELSSSESWNRQARGSAHDRLKSRCIINARYWLLAKTWAVGGFFKSFLQTCIMRPQFIRLDSRRRGSSTWCVTGALVHIKQTSSYSLLLPNFGRVKPQRQRDKKKRKKNLHAAWSAAINFRSSFSFSFSPISERLSSCSFTPPLIPSLEAAWECTPFQFHRPVHVNVWSEHVARQSLSLSPRILLWRFEGGAPSHSQPLNHFDYGAVLF